MGYMNLTMTIATKKKKRKCSNITVRLFFDCFLRSIICFSYKTVCAYVTVRPELLKESKWKRKVIWSSTHGKTITRVPSL